MMLKTALVFGNNMLLQRDKCLPVWGSGIPDRTINCKNSMSALFRDKSV